MKTRIQETTTKMKVKYVVVRNHTILFPCCIEHHWILNKLHGFERPEYVQECGFALIDSIQGKVQVIDKIDQLHDPESMRAQWYDALVDCERVCQLYQKMQVKS